MSTKHKLDGVDDCDRDNILAGDIFLFHLLPYMEEDLVKRHIAASSADPSCKHIFGEYTKKDKDRMCATFGTALEPQPHSSSDAIEEGRQLIKYVADRGSEAFITTDGWSRHHIHTDVDRQDPDASDAIFHVLKSDVPFSLELKPFGCIPDNIMSDALRQTRTHTIDYYEFGIENQVADALFHNPNTRCLKMRVSSFDPTLPLPPFTIDGDIPHVYLDVYLWQYNRRFCIGNNMIHTLLFVTNPTTLDVHAILACFPNVTLPHRMMFIGGESLYSEMKYICNLCALSDVWFARLGHLDDVWFSPYGTTEYTQTNDRTEIDAELDLYEFKHTTVVSRN